MLTIIWFIYFWLILVALSGLMFRASNARKKGNYQLCEKITQRWVPWWANSLLKLAGVKVVVHGKENLPKEPCVFVANHQGYFDIPVVLTSLNKSYGLMSKKEVLKMPLIRTWMKNLYCVFVDRSNPREAMKSLNQALGYVKEGKSMIIFPEGTRSKDGNIAEFKSGSFRIATKAKVPLVPLRIEGTRDIMENNGYWIKKGVVEIYILPAVPTQNLDKTQIDKLPEKLRQIIITDRENNK